ncbi:MAG TPA: hypothetical protein VFW84_10745 [Aquabacterium sp.]|uniref:hypothetical protein n=1 Tax=Aquabacterium sp. TaxID=1872578 RepID=UPI002E375BFD|nr:hypothetical protein [Aquabacterium sp.]HEX5373197.1 hypothetical protein [Aquabacterium sp.]
MSQNAIIRAGIALFTALSITALIGCAQVHPAAASSASAPAAPWASAAYKGRFDTSCMAISEGLYYFDILTLTPTDARTVSAVYQKAFFGAEDCPADSLLVTLTLPTSTWVLDGQTKIDGRTVDQVTVTLVEGLLQSTTTPRAKTTDSDKNLLIEFGNPVRQVAIQKFTEGSVDKELRLLENNRLYISPPDKPKTDGTYPDALDMDFFFSRR